MSSLVKEIIVNNMQRNTARRFPDPTIVSNGFQQTEMSCSRPEQVLCYSPSYEPTHELEGVADPSIFIDISQSNLQDTAGTVTRNSYQSRHCNNSSATSSSVGSGNRKLNKDIHNTAFTNDLQASGYTSCSEIANNSRTNLRGKQPRSFREESIIDAPRAEKDRYAKVHKTAPKLQESKPISHLRNDSKVSVTESDFSGSSKEKKKKSDQSASAKSLDSKFNSDLKIRKTSIIRNVYVTVTNNIQYNPKDPFSFIQPSAIPFLVKVRKCMAPIKVVLLLLVLAAALGAAIYFASVLKETQAAQIDLLRANLAFKIKTIQHVDNIEKLTLKDFQSLSATYCKQMDVYYRHSDFSDIYRGCKVTSIQNRYINFTLFFDERKPTSSQIIDVIKSSANITKEVTQQLAIIDKFELELDSAVIEIDRRMEAETFNKKAPENINPLLRESEAQVPSKIYTKVASTRVRYTMSTTVTVSSTPQQTVPRNPEKKIPPSDTPVYSWDPCKEYDGVYFPHPTECDMFLQCSNEQTVVQRCTKGLLYHWKQLTCVSKLMLNVQCPDHSKAPLISVVIAASTSSMAYTTQVTASQNTANNSQAFHYGNLEIGTAIAGKFPHRPKYSPDPCTHIDDVKLYPHPEDCAKFIQCVNGKVQTMNCAPGLVFEPQNSACIFPLNDLLCPDIKPCADKDTGHFPHPYNCSKFIQCDYKQEKIISCQNDLVWNTAVNSCVHNTSSNACL